MQDPSEAGQTGRAAPHVNGKQTAKGKRKAVAAPSEATRQPPPHEPIEILEEESDCEVAESEVLQPGKQKKTQPSTTRMGKGDESKLREQLRQVRLPVFLIFDD